MSWTTLKQIHGYCAGLMIVITIITTCGGDNNFTCDSGILLDERYCIQPVHNPLTWSKARQQALSTGGDLLAILNSQFQEAVEDLLSNINSTFWIGLTQTASLPFAWQQSSFENISVLEVQDQGCFLEYLSSPEFTVSMNVTGALTRDNCVAACSAHGYLYAVLQGGPYQITCFCSDTFGKYPQANGGCTTQCPGNSSQTCGGDYMNNVLRINGSWILWQSGQPNNDAGFQQCAAFLKDSSGQFKNIGDFKCSQPAPFICELPAENCTGHQIRNHCLQLSNKSSSWFNAHEQCRSQYGNLLSISSSDFYNAVVAWLKTVNLTKSQIWIGLTRAYWTWSFDDSEFVYSNFSSLEPTNINMSCVYISTADHYTWKTADCNTVMHYLMLTENKTAVTAATTEMTITTSAYKGNRTGGMTTVITTMAMNESVISESLVSPTAEASTSDNKLSTAAIGAIVAVCVAILIALIIVLCLILCHKNIIKHMRVHPKSFDGRPFASIPCDGYLGDPTMICASESGSTTALIHSSSSSLVNGAPPRHTSMYTQNPLTSKNGLKGPLVEPDQPIQPNGEYPKV